MLRHKIGWGIFSWAQMGEAGMPKKDTTIDFARLFGFASVSDHLSGKVDFQDLSVGSKLGAKVGDKFWATCDLQAREPAQSAVQFRRKETGT